MTYCVIDTETTGLYPEFGHRIFLAGFAFYDEKFKLEKMEMLYWDKAANKKKAEKYLKDKKLIKILHNASFDIKMFLYDGMMMEYPIHDTYIMARMASFKQFKSYKLKELGKEIFNIDNPEQVAIDEWLKRKENKDKNFSHIPKKLIEAYFKKDLMLPIKMYQHFWPQIESDADLKSIYLEEANLTRVLAKMEFHGHKIDRAHLEKHKKLYQKRIDKLLSEIKKATNKDFNPASDKQIQELIEKKKLPIINFTETEKASVASDTLLQYGIPLFDKIVEYNHLTKMQSAFIEGILEKLDKDDVLHTHYNQIITTGRISASDPNLQNMPTAKSGKDKKQVIRSAFIPRSKDYMLVYYDYKQIEIRINAIECQEPALLDAIRKGEDLHQTVADICGGIGREHAKQLQLGIIYGMGRMAIVGKFCKEGYESPEFAKGFAKAHKEYLDLMKANRRQEAFKISDIWWNKSKAAPALEAFFAGLPLIKEFRDEAVRRVKQRVAEEGQGYIRTLFGRRTVLWPGTEYKAINYIVQGSAADILKIAMNKVDRVLDGTKSRMLLTIHDEIVCEIHKKEKHLIQEVKKALEDFQLDVPLLTDASMSETSWGDKCAI